MIFGAGATLGGCRSYEARPLDLPSFRDAWSERDAAGPGVREFAARFDAESGALAGSFDTADGLTVREGEVVALFFNPDLRVARLRAGVAAATLEHSGLWDDPTLGVDAKKLLEGVSNPWKLFAGVGITLPVSGRLEAETARAGAEHAAELARVANDEWTVRVTLRGAWSEWSAARARADATRDYLAGLDRVVAITDALYEAGELSSSQTRPFHVERALRRADLRAFEGDAAVGEAGLRSLMGLTPAAPVVLVPGIGGMEVTDDPEEVSDRSPAMLLAAAEYEVSERRLALEVRKQYPDITLVPGVGDDRGTTEIGLGVSLAVPILNANRQGIAEAEARREEARAAYESEFERLCGRLAVARARRDAARAQRVMLESDVSELVDAQYDEARRIAELGEVDTLLLLDTLRSRHETRLRIVDARLAEAIAAVRERELIGPRAVVANVAAPDGNPTETSK